MRNRLIIRIKVGLEKRNHLLRLPPILSIMGFPSMRKCACIFICMLAASAPLASSSSFSTCKRDSLKFLRDLNSHCPLSIHCSSSPIQVDGESLEIALSSTRENEYTAVLFYAAWCPFSLIFQSRFSALSSMYPQIKHIMVEQTSVFPSIYLRHGIHSVPTLVIVNQRARMRYYGQKDLRSVVNFYKRTTGLDPVVDMAEDVSCNLESEQKVFGIWEGAAWKEIFLREPYLLVSIIFVLLRVCLYLFPEIASRMMGIWLAYIPHLNMGIFGESRQLVGRALHLIDVKRIGSKLNVCKTRKFHKGARKARVWASSLASVSLGESNSFQGPF